MNVECICETSWDGCVEEMSVLDAEIGRWFPSLKEDNCIPPALPVSKEATLCEFPVEFSTVPHLNPFDSP